MNLSKKELSVLIEIIYSILFALLFLPYFYENRFTSFDFIDNIFLWLVWGKIGQMIIFSAIYYSIGYTLLHIFNKEKIIKDERDDMISSRSYKLGFLLYELSLFVFIGVLLSNSSFQNSGFIIFFILLLLLSVIFIKSSYQLYLYRKS
tara:strand:+ start:1304 stop:1747 length:444 start_codon:yes stop_codon:yes gene_type:complete